MGDQRESKELEYIVERWRVREEVSMKRCKL